MSETICDQKLECPKQCLINEIASYAAQLMPEDSREIWEVARQEKEILAMGCEGAIEVKNPIETELPSPRLRKFLGMRATDISISTSFVCRS